MKVLIFLYLLILLSGCTSSEDAKRALNGAGYTKIQIGGYQFFGCSGSDLLHTKFIAKNPLGKTVDGVVCSGLFFKGATIRF